MSIDHGSVYRVLDMHLQEHSKATLSELVALTDRFAGTKDDWRQAAILLALDARNMRRLSDVAQLRDATSALDNIRRELDWFDGVHRRT